jgi:hypothetical protein
MNRVKLTADKVEWRLGVVRAELSVARLIT